MKKTLTIAAILGMPVIALMFAAMLIAQAQANCGDGDLSASYDAPGSLGGVMGTGVTRAEIQSARKHPLGGTQITENQYRSTAYAPAAGGINCDSNGSCASTASGIRVDGGKRKAYLIATNPKLNKYGALVYIWPNPYKWTGPFVVADTGGNFDGSDGTYRVDFYIWGDKGESFSNQWGNARMVKLSKTQISAAGAVNAASSAPRSTASAAALTNPVKFRRPTSGPYTSPFGQRWGRLHAGVDIAPPQGTPIVAALAGRVILAGQVGGYGNYTCIRHSAKLTTCYGHQERFARGIKAGVLVQQSQLIGYVGNTGHSTGPHLHFEVRTGPSATSTPVDPKPYLEGSESVVPADTTSSDEAGACPAADEAPNGQGAQAVEAVADWMDKQRFPYCWGGGHSDPSKPSSTNADGTCTHSSGSFNGKGPGFDCSGSTSFILQHAGVKVPTMASTGFMTWGSPGPGKYVSIYANAEHVFMKIGNRFFSTSVTNSRSGPGWVPASVRSTAGFVVRHPEGM